MPSIYKMLKTQVYALHGGERLVGKNYQLTDNLLPNWWRISSPSWV